MTELDQLRQAIERMDGGNPTLAQSGQVRETLEGKRSRDHEGGYVKLGHYPIVRSPAGRAAVFMRRSASAERASYVRVHEQEYNRREHVNA